MSDERPVRRLADLSEQGWVFLLAPNGQIFCEVRPEYADAVAYALNAGSPAETEEPRYEGTPVSTWVLREWVKHLDAHGTLDAQKVNLRTALFAVAQELEDGRRMKWTRPAGNVDEPAGTPTDSEEPAQ